MTWLLDPIRRLRATPLAFVGLALLVGITAFIATAGPRLFDRVSRDSIQGAIAAIPPSGRVITLSQTESLQGLPGFGDLATVDQNGARLRRTMPDQLYPVLGDAVTVVETPSYRAVEGVSLDAELRLRIMEDVTDHIHLVSGRAPTDAIGSVPDPLHSGSSGSGVPEPVPLPEFEAEVSSVAADKLGLKVGSELVMAPQSVLDPLSGGGAVGVKIVGIYAPNSLTDAYWLADDRVTGYALRDFSANITFVQSTFLVAPELFGPLETGRALHGSTSGGITISAPALRISWRYAADPAKIEPDRIGPVVDALRRLQAIYPGVPRNPEDVAMQTGLLVRLVALQGPWSAAGALLVVAALGAAAVALASLALVIALTAEERRRVLLIQRERGASALQALRGTIIEGLVSAVPAGAIGIVAAVWLLPRSPDMPSLALGAAVILAAVLFVLATVLGAALGPPRLPTRARAAVRSARARRLVFDAVIVGIALAAANALRERGLQAAGGGAATAATGAGQPGVVPPAPDPLLAAAPVLIGVAAAVIAIRLAPLPLAVLARAAGLGRGLAPVLAARRAARDSGAARVLLIVLAIATLGAFASATVVEMGATVELQAWQDVGAPYRVDAAADQLGGGTSLPDALDARALPGVTSAVRAHLSSVALSTGGQRELVALDLATYGAMLSGSPVALRIPPELLAAPAGAGSGGTAAGTAAGAAGTAGTAANPLPAIVSAVSSGPFKAFAVGDQFAISFQSQPVTFRVAAIADSFPSLPAGQPFVVASWPQIDAAAPNRLTNATSLYLSAPAGDGSALSAALKPAAPIAIVSDRSAEAANLSGQGVVGIVLLGVLTLVAIALLYAALAIVAAFVLTASTRADEAAHLATLGLSDRQSWSMLILEFGPPVALAAVAGAALGLGLFAFLAPGLGLTTIVGALQAAPPGLDPAQIGLLAVLIAAILAIGVTLGAPAQRRAARASVRRGLQ